MPHFKDLHEREYIDAHDLGGRDRTLTIKKITFVDIRNRAGKKERMPIVFFEGSKTGKGWVLNKTNAATIASLYGEYSEEWIGKRITLYPSTVVNAEKKTVPCIRVRPAVPMPHAASTPAEPEQPTEQTHEAPTDEVPEGA